jgi:predicted oxidoreductase
MPGVHFEDGEDPSHGQPDAVPRKHQHGPTTEHVNAVQLAPPNAYDRMSGQVGMGADFGDNLLDFCAQNGIAVTAYSPLGGGAVLASGSPFEGPGKAIATKYKYRGVNGTMQPVQPAQVALAWIGQRHGAMPQMALVTKSNNPEYLAEDLALWGAGNCIIPLLPCVQPNV